MTATPHRVRTPGELVSLVPQLLGFVPHESLVAVGLRGSSRRVGLTVRVDLADGAALLPRLVSGLSGDGARSALLVVHTGAPSAGAHPQVELVASARTALRERGIGPAQALLVRDGRWWSYDCTSSCCPPEGTLLDGGGPVLEALAAEQAYAGRAVLGSRAALVESLAPRPPEGVAAARRAQVRVGQELARRARRDPSGTARGEADRWVAALDAWEQQPAPLAQATGLALALRLPAVRDAVALLSLERSEPLLGLLHALCRTVVPPDDAPVCALLAWVAYGRGDGALALVAVQRALASQPAQPLAGLLLAALDAALPPERVRGLLRPAG